MNRIRAGALLLSLFAAAASAEDYTTFSRGQMTQKSEYFGTKFKDDGWDAFLGGRYDMPSTPLFVIADYGTWRLHSDFSGFHGDAEIWRYDIGGGYAWHPAHSTEVYGRLDYYHMDGTFIVTGFDPFSGSYIALSGDAQVDGGRGAVGVNAWFGDTFKGYVEVAYLKESHKVSGYQAVPGIEAKVSKDFRVFLEYSYAKETDRSLTPTGHVTLEIVNVGIKIPFGGAPQAARPVEPARAPAGALPAAREPAKATVPEPPPPVSPAPAPGAEPAVPSAVPAPAGASTPEPARAATAGQTAKIKGGGTLRARPTASSDAIPAAADTIVTLKSSLQNGDGTWWYVTAGAGTGWILESDLDLGGR